MKFKKFEDRWEEKNTKELEEMYESFNMRIAITITISLILAIGLLIGGILLIKNSKVTLMGVTKIKDEQMHTIGIMLAVIGGICIPFTPIDVVRNLNMKKKLRNYIDARTSKEKVSVKNK